MRHVAITGAGGFVCSEIAVAMAAAGWRVTALDRSFDAAARARLAGLDQVEADLLAAPGTICGLAPDAVIHGAALTVAPENAGMTRAAHLVANIEMQTRALAEARAAGTARFLFLSSTGVFDTGDGIGQDRLTENVRPTGQGPYAAAKRAGEEITLAAAEPGFSTLALRLGNIMGPAEAPRPSRPGLSLPHRMAAEASRGPIRSGCTGASREWAWLPDLAQGIAALVEALPSLQPEVIHAGMPPVLADAEMARLIAPTAVVDFARTGPMRPPMGSIRRSPLSDIAWTPVAEGLARLGLAGVRA